MRSINAELAGGSIVSVVIPTHNRKRLLLDCLRSIVNSDYRNIAVFVIDDGSTDGTSEEVNRQFPTFKVLNGDGNLWWSGAMNLGVTAALNCGTDYVMALNDDVALDRHAVSALVECALREKEKSIVGSVIYSAETPQVIWCAGGEMRWPWPGERMLASEQGHNVQSQEKRYVDWTPGMGTLMPREVFSVVGMYDAERMPQYLADVDFTLRARKAGYRILVTPRSKVYNRVNSTGGLTKAQVRLSISDVLAVFASPKSPEYFRARSTFIWRHCPIQWIIPAFLMRYARLSGFLLKRLAVN